MYITNTTENVRKLIEELAKQNDISKLKFIIYVFNLLNNNQVNDKNELNPDLLEDDNLKIFNLEAIGLSPNACTILLQYFAMIYNGMTNSKDAYEDNGTIMGITYSKEDQNIVSQFEKLDYNEKLDVFSEIIIRYDNETFFDERTLVLSFGSELDGFNITKMIKDFKE